MRWIAWMVLMVPLAGCALGSASAAYSLKAKTAEELTPSAEQRIVDRAKQETITELQAKDLIKKAEH